MKSSSVPNEQDGSVLSRVGRRRFNVAKRKSQALEACHWVEGMKLWPPLRVNAAAKFSNTAYVLSRTGHFNTPGQRTGLPLPPISGSRRSADPASGRRLGSVQPQTCPGSVLTAKSTFGVFVSQGRTVILKAGPCNRTHAAPGAGDKAAIQPARQPQEPSPSADPATRPRNGASRRGGQLDLSRPKPQRDACSGRSAADTESESSADKDGQQTAKGGGDDEYYNEQRISDWILEVNSSLFSTGNKELTGPRRAQEHDVATIKMVYSGE